MTIEDAPFPAEIPFGQEISTRWLKDGVPVIWRMVVISDSGGTLEAAYVYENDHGQEVFSIAAGTTGREQIIEVGEAWDVDRAVHGFERGFETRNDDATPEKLESFRRWWTSQGLSE